MENLAQFAERKRLRIKRDEVGELMIPGRIGHLYEHDCGVFGLMLVSPNGDDPKLDSTFRSRMRKALREGLKLHQCGDYESTFLFNAENKKDARLAIQLAGIKCRRHQGGKGKPLTSERASYLAQIRHGCAREGREKAKSRGISPQAEELVEVGV